MLFECFTFTFLFNLIKQGKLSQRKPCYFSNKKWIEQCIVLEQFPILAVPTFINILDSCQAEILLIVACIYYKHIQTSFASYS